MKKYYKNGNIFAISIMSLFLLFHVDAQAQRHQWPIGWPQDGADDLARFGRIDTNDIVRIRKIADSCGHNMNSSACLFLAQHGYKDIIPKIIECYYHSIDRNDLLDMYKLTVALVTLDTALAHPYVLALFDTMIVHKREMKWMVPTNGDLIDVIRLLLDKKDYSKYDFFKSCFTGEDKPSGYSIEEFYRFAENPSLAQDAYEMVKGLLSNDDEDYRYNAQQTLYWFTSHPDRVSLFKNIALNDASAKIREEASSRLEYMGYMSDAIQCYESLIRSKIDTFYCDLAVNDLADINSPYALAALLRLKGELEPGELLNHLESKIDADNVPFSLLYDSLTVRDFVDSLGAFVHQCVSIGWLGNQSFVTQLDKYITDSKTSLNSRDSVDCARKIKLFQQSIDKEYKDSLNITSNFVTTEGWKFLYYNAQYISDRLPLIPPSGCNVKLVNSTGVKLTGGSLQYYDGSWKDATNNQDGTFSIDTKLKTLSLRMTYEYGTQTKFNVTVGYDTIAFQTVNARIQLQNSSGVLIDTGSVQYYAGAWRNLGTTLNGTATKELLPANYSFRMSYTYASKDKQQDIGTNATVIFQTVNAAVQLQNSQGSLIDQGTVQYYSGAWRDLGTTTNGVATKELLPNNYSFRMTYAYASKDKQQDIGTNATVVFQTVNAAVQLKNSLGNLIDQGTVQYYSGAWRDLGTTTNGIVNKELLPNNYSFRMTYAYASKDKQQDITSNATVVFQTVNATVQLQNSQGNFIDQGTVQYYSGAWRTLGTTTNGTATKELLPNNYSFRMTYEYVSVDKSQDLSANSTVGFSTVLCTIRVKNSQNQLVNNALASYYSGAWRQIGNTVNGEITKELLPVNLSFRVKYGTQQQDKQQNLSTNNIVEFTLP